MVNFQDFYKIIDERNKEMDPETSYKVSKEWISRSVIEVFSQSKKLEFIV